MKPNWNKYEKIHYLRWLCKLGNDIAFYVIVVGAILSLFATGFGMFSIIGFVYRVCYILGDVERYLLKKEWDCI